MTHRESCELNTSRGEFTTIRGGFAAGKGLTSPLPAEGIRKASCAHRCDPRAAVGLWGGEGVLKGC
eukprot:1195479-Prorocentrum_minimum.AAC.2